MVGPDASGAIAEYSCTCMRLDAARHDFCAQGMLHSLSLPAEDEAASRAGQTETEALYQTVISKHCLFCARVCISSGL